MFLQIGLPRQPNTVIYEKVMNSNDVSVLLSILCNGRGEHPGWCEATDYFIRWSWLVCSFFQGWMSVLVAINPLKMSPEELNYVGVPG